MVDLTKDVEDSSFGCIRRGQNRMRGEGRETERSRFATSHMGRRELAEVEVGTEYRALCYTVMAPGEERVGNPACLGGVAGVSTHQAPGASSQAR